MLMLTKLTDLASQLSTFNYSTLREFAARTGGDADKIADWIEKELEVKEGPND